MGLEPGPSRAPYLAQSAMACHCQPCPVIDGNQPEGIRPSQHSTRERFLQQTFIRRSTSKEILRSQSAQSSQPTKSSHVSRPASSSGPRRQTTQGRHGAALVSLGQPLAPACGQWHTYQHALSAGLQAFASLGRRLWPWPPPWHWPWPRPRPLSGPWPCSWPWLLPWPKLGPWPWPWSWPCSRLWPWTWFFCWPWPEVPACIYHKYE